MLIARLVALGCLFVLFRRGCCYFDVVDGLRLFIEV